MKNITSVGLFYQKGKIHGSSVILESRGISAEIIDISCLWQSFSDCLISPLSPSANAQCIWRLLRASALPMVQLTALVGVC